jgi:hypothetical protein
VSKPDKCQMERGSPKYGRYIEWTTLDGRKYRVDSRFHYNIEEATKEALTFAKLLGWTPPRWWQWWRWGDTRFTEMYDVSYTTRP